MRIKKGRGISLLFPFLFLGRRERKEATAAPHELLTGAAPSYRHLRVFGCTCFVHILAQLREKLSSRQALVSFLDMLSPNIDGCYDVKSKRLDVSLNVLFNEVTSYFPFLN